MGLTVCNTHPSEPWTGGAQRRAVKLDIGSLLPGGLLEGVSHTLRGSCSVQSCLCPSLWEDS